MENSQFKLKVHKFKCSECDLLFLVENHREYHVSWYGCPHCNEIAEYMEDIEMIQESKLKFGGKRAITEINEDFHSIFPRVCTTAETYGFAQEDIEKLINILQNDKNCMTIYQRQSTLETVLKMIINRLNLQRDDFYSHVQKKRNVLYWYMSEFEKAETLVGKYALLAYTTIIKEREKILSRTE